MNIDRGYINNMRNTAAAIELQAAEARRRGVYGLETSLHEAAVAAASWANALEDELADLEARAVVEDNVRRFRR